MKIKTGYFKSSFLIRKKYKSLALLLPSVGKLHIFVTDDIREVTNYV